MAPWAPFVAEELHQKIVRPAEPDAPDSIHLGDFPGPASRPRDEALEEAMSEAMAIVEAGRAARSLASLKIRQPLQRLLVCPAGQPAAAVSRAVDELADLIEDELNVREVELAGPERLFRYEIKPNFKAMGPVFGKEVNRVAEAIRSLPAGPMARLASGQTIPLHVDGREVEIHPALVEVVRHPAEGLSLADQGGLIVAVEVAVTQELRREGRVREVVHRLQTLRKDSGLAVTDRISVDYWATPDLKAAVEAWAELVRTETLAVALTAREQADGLAADWDVDGESFRVSIRATAASRGTEEQP